jgi:hypothetical protein
LKNFSGQLSRHFLVKKKVKLIDYFYKRIKFYNNLIFKIFT